MREMALVDHLQELRKRIIFMVIIVFVSFFATYSVGGQIQEFLLVPLRSALGEEGKIVFAGLLEKVLAQFQLAFWTSLIVSAPFTFHQIWLFIKPGLYEKEVKLIRPFIFLGFILFCLGVGFGYYIVFPFTFGTLLNFGEVEVEAFMNMKDYLILSSKILVFLGIIFQLPNAMLIMGYMGIVSGKKLVAAMKYVVVAFAIISAMLTPPDPITMMALWIPLVLLYLLGVLLVYVLVDPFKSKESEDLVPTETETDTENQ